MESMKLFWKIYAWFFLALVSTNAGQFFDSDSMLTVYYHTTIIFNNWYTIPYILNILNAVLYCILCLFIFGYAYDINGISRLAPFYFFLRLLSDATGHTYELKIIQSSFAQSKLAGLVGLACLSLLVLPSYLVHWKMTFEKS